MKKKLLILLVLASFSAMAEKPTKEAVDSACGEDIQKSCPNLDKRELMECLKENKDSLAQSCNELLSKMGPPRRRR